jgi:hypothetical protein
VIFAGILLSVFIRRRVNELHSLVWSSLMAKGSAHLMLDKCSSRDGDLFAEKDRFSVGQNVSRAEVLSVECEIHIAIVEADKMELRMRA